MVLSSVRPSVRREIVSDQTSMPSARWGLDDGIYRLVIGGRGRGAICLSIRENHEHSMSFVARRQTQGFRDDINEDLFIYLK